MTRSPIAIPLRSLGALYPTLGRTPIPTVGLTLRTSTSHTRAIAGAVTLASVARAADEDCCAATGTEKAADGFSHRRSSNNRRAHRQAKAPRAMLAERSYSLRWRGRGIRFGLQGLCRCRARFSPAVPGALHRQHQATLAPGIEETSQPTAAATKVAAPIARRRICAFLDRHQHVCRLQVLRSSFRRFIASPFERNVFLMTSPARPPAFRDLMKCCKNKYAVSPERIGKFC